MSSIGICHKRKCEIIRAIIDNETFETDKLKAITGYTDEDISVSVMFYKTSNYVVYKSLTEDGIYYLYNKNTSFENQLKIDDEGFIMGRYHIDRETSNALKSFGFKREY